MLNYMKSEGVHWPIEELTDMLQEVGTLGAPLPLPLVAGLVLAAGGLLETAKWLRNEGAEWPTVLKYGDMHWLMNIVRWARQSGCTSAHTEEAYE
jgi:hypothetical protein